MARGAVCPTCSGRGGHATLKGRSWHCLELCHSCGGKGQTHGAVKFPKDGLELAEIKCKGDNVTVKLEHRTGFQAWVQLAPYLQDVLHHRKPRAAL
jgi:DnaJ-class molecular chaperone